MVRDESARNSIVGKRELPYIPGLHSFVKLTDSRGHRLSLHEASEVPGQFWLTGLNKVGDYRPFLLDLDQVRALRDACELILSDSQARD